MEKFYDVESIKRITHNSLYGVLIPSYIKVINSEILKTAKSGKSYVSIDKPNNDTLPWNEWEVICNKLRENGYTVGHSSSFISISW